MHVSELSAMASSVAQLNKEIDFEPLHPDKAPLCDRCGRITYTVHQATCCGAYFCESCGESCKVAQSTYRTCPKCFKNLGQISYDYNETQKRTHFEVYCRNKRAGCQHKDEIRCMDQHLVSCSYEKVSCKHEKCNQKVFRKDLQYHHENCPSRIVQCQYCKDRLRAAHLEKYHYYNGCQDFPKECPNKCGTKVTDRELSKHKETCTHEPLGCLLNKYGCTQTVARHHMTQHVLDYKHIELLIKEIDKSHKDQQSMRQMIQSLQAEVQALKNNYNLVHEDMGRLDKSQKDLKTDHQKLLKQVNNMEKDFQLYKKAFEIFKAECKKEQDDVTHNLLNQVNPIEESIENLMVECKMIQDGITQTTTLPFRFILNNTDELAMKEEGHQSPYFYTKCRRHKLGLTVFPGGRGATRGNFMSVWLRRIDNYGIKSNKLPQRVKIQVVVALISQLPNTTETDNFVATIDAIVHQNQQEEIIFKRDDFIPFRELDYFERRKRVFSRAIQYKMDDSLLFEVRSAVEATL